MQKLIILILTSFSAGASAQTHEIVLGETNYYQRRMSASTEFYHQFFRNNPNGHYLVYHDDSKTRLAADFNWFERDQIGHCRWWNEEGDLTTEFTKDSIGRLQGHYLAHGRFGTKKTVGQFVNDCKHGEWLKFDSQGRLHGKTSYNMGVIELTEYWKYEIIMPEFTKQQVQEANLREGEFRFKKRGKSRLIEREKTWYSEGKAVQQTVFDKKGRIKFEKMFSTE